MKHIDRIVEARLERQKVILDQDPLAKFMSQIQDQLQTNGNLQTELNGQCQVEFIDRFKIQHGLTCPTGFTLADMLWQVKQAGDRKITIQTGPFTHAILIASIDNRSAVQHFLKITLIHANGSCTIH